MKGLVISLLAFAAYVVGTMALSHVLKPVRHSDFFKRTLVASFPVYFLAYALTPGDLFFLPASWQARPAWFDLLYGFLVYVLNCHSYVDVFFGINSGFSSSLMLEILRHGERGATTDEIVARYAPPGQPDVIYGWRVPYLQQRGYLLMDEASGTCRLAPKGLLIARITHAVKRLLNLGRGG